MSTTITRTPDELSITSPASYVVPKAYVESVGDEEFNKAPIGTGPFKFVAHDPTRSMTFEANTDYWGEGPYVSSLDLEIVSETSTRIANLAANL